MICLYIGIRFLKIFEQPAFVLPEVLGLIRQASVDEDLRSLSFYKEPLVNVLPPIEAGASCFSENSAIGSEELQRLTLSPQA